MEDLFNLIADQIVKDSIDELGIDKERLDYLQEALVTRIIKKLETREIEKPNEIIIKSAMEMITDMIMEKKPLSDNECTALGLTTIIIIKKLVTRLHKDSSSHDCKTCIADYICNPDNDDDNEEL